MNSVKTNNDLITLAQWMAGDFSNYKQSFEKPQQFAHIHIFIGFYSEQVYDHDLWTPYRQGVHKLIDQGEQIYIENYSLNDPVQYAGAARELSILKTIKPDCIQRRYNCSMVFKREGEMFRGSVEPGNQCLIEKKGCSTYLISDVEITETTWSSLDRGMDVNTHEQIWGSENGSLWFEKRQSFAGELPPL
ncbi:chromophore lyase CpcT/CpeT [Microcoleus sp. PH2017_05_CCC_O_A]|uniref:chromophore lyase CpcT/CpeT n=1 Tax=Microcoleus sp. PH2017_05_CCC_O_A TaxID=2798816 RepID=UPI001DFE4784|nr:chromophore lyase CpcT/CpeT [Microcoleus sp. PH2017_05_CCC_O_A]MCC3440106.1 chromophore lyase CpcT/CpeT [Microcoleus sp. PH2017_05_CCC_O_A]